MSNCQHKSCFTYSMLGSLLKTIEQHIAIFSYSVTSKTVLALMWIISVTRQTSGLLAEEFTALSWILQWEKSYKQFILPTYIRLLLNHMGPSPPMLNSPMVNKSQVFSFIWHPPLVNQVGMALETTCHNAFWRRQRARYAMYYVFFWYTYVVVEAAIPTEH